jgi:hypothetical protein
MTQEHRTTPREAYEALDMNHKTLNNLKTLAFRNNCKAKKILESLYQSHGHGQGCPPESAGHVSHHDKETAGKVPIKKELRKCRE